MAEYTFRLAGGVAHFKKVECATLDEARNEAVRFLGSYLSEHPGFADEGHWRVNVEDAFGLPLLHVIVATVTSREIRSRNAA